MSGNAALNDATFRRILRPDKSFFYLALIYGIGIALLTLAVPVSVQVLLNTVVNTRLAHFVLILAGFLFLLLLVFAILIAFRDYAMELFQRRFLARLAAEATLRLTHADQSYMESINRAELVNRFFEIMHVQKSVPDLLSGGFFIALQALVGMTVVSFYHPFLFIYNVVFMLSLYLCWVIWSKTAIRKAYALSDSKYDLVQWLEEIARVDLAFKSTEAITFAVEETNKYTEAYLVRKKSFFRTTFVQNIAFLVLYGIASAGLLGLGGVLVTRDQLSLGQLVGAELIMSVVFYGLSKLGYYARIYYELLASINKLGYFYNLPLEERDGTFDFPTERKTVDIAFENVSVVYRNHRFSFNCRLPANAKVLAKSIDSTGSKLFLDLVKAYRPPNQGRILMAGQDLKDYNTHGLRSSILAVENMTIVEGTIRGAFYLQTPKATLSEIMSTLQLVELDDVISKLPQGLDTHLVPSGYPLLQDEVIRLKLAAAVLANPAILVLTEMLDTVPYQLRKRILMQLCTSSDMMIICFTNRKEWEFFEHYLFMDETGTYQFNSLFDYQLYENQYVAESQL